MNKKRMGAMVCTAALAVSLMPAALAAGTTATPSTHKVFVDGKQVEIAGYAINGNNYFKLRDIAMAVKGSKAQFNVVWDKKTGAVEMYAGQAYSPVGGEMGKIPSGTKQAGASTSNLQKDGSKAELTGYNIAYNNYFKLRDVAKTFDFEVTWDEKNRQVNIDTTKAYTEETTGKEILPTQKTLLASKADVNMPDGTYSAAFKPSKDLKKTETGYTLATEFFNYDSYEAQDILGLKAGDTIQVQGKKIIVQTIKQEKTNGKVDGVYVNGEIEQGGTFFYLENNGYFRTMIFDDYPLYYSIGEAVLPISRDVQIVDHANDSGADGAGVISGYDKLESSLSNDDYVGFTEDNTQVTICGGEIVKIAREWTP